MASDGSILQYNTKCKLNAIDVYSHYLKWTKHSWNIYIFPRHNRELYGGDLITFNVLTQSKKCGKSRPQQHDQHYRVEKRPNSFLREKRGDFALTIVQKEEGAEKEIRLSVRTVVSPYPEKTLQTFFASVPGNELLLTHSSWKEEAQAFRSRGSRCWQLTALCGHSLTSISLLFLCSFRSVFAFSAVGKWC